jgi:hypothetical protein
MDHDQNFKNLILNYPLQALQLFAQVEADALGPEVRIIPIRQEQLKAKLGDRFRELDVPLEVVWPNGEKEALLFVLEEETNPRRFSTHRLAHYCLDLSELRKTTRVVPVVIFLRGQTLDVSLRLGGDRHTYLKFNYLSCTLSQLPWQEYKQSDNIVARLNLPNMLYKEKDKIHVYAQAFRGLKQLESDPKLQEKYIDFIDIYTQLSNNELEQYQLHYPQEAQQMESFTQRNQNIGLKQGMQQGMQQGEVAILKRLMKLKFGDIPASVHAKIMTADCDTLLLWSDRLLTANTPEEVCH